MKSGTFNMKSSAFHEKHMKSTEKHLKGKKTAYSTQMSDFDLVFYRVQSEGQPGISYILVVFGGTHVCLVVFVCIYGVCMDTYVGLS